jgi:integrase
VEVAIAAWLHAKLQRSGSSKTHTTYAAILREFRGALVVEGLDLDSADPRRCDSDRAAVLHTPVVSDTPASAGGDLPPAWSGSVADLSADRAAAIALMAQAFAARPAETRYGPRAVAPTTANLRLAALSSFYTYALRQDLLRGPNPIARVERRPVTSYAAARPLERDDLQARLAAIDVGTSAGLRDYALLLVGLHTGRRVAELAGMRREHLRIRTRSVDITWPRCKGGKAMRDTLPRGGARGEAADALVAWVDWLEVARTGDVVGRTGSTRSTQDADTRAAGSVPFASTALARAWRQLLRPLWISLARNGTAGHPLTARAIAHLCEKRLGTSKVHALRHTFAKTMEEAGAKVSHIQAALGHADLGTTGRYLASLQAGENPHLARISSLYGLSGFDQRILGLRSTSPMDTADGTGRTTPSS